MANLKPIYVCDVEHDIGIRGQNKNSGPMWKVPGCYLAKD
jgi:hypothetical protein